MPARSRKKRPADLNSLAYQVVQEATAEKEPVPEKNAAAVELGRLGGRMGGKARAASLSPEQRAEIAKRAAQARWNKPR
jgi:hypothetical protein